MFQLIPAQIPGGPELVILLLIGVVNIFALIGILGGIGYFILRIRSGGSVDDRLNRIERKIGRLEAEVDELKRGDESS